ncbi:hypothetical protein BU25DRAFT_445646 [Macroventuria anomochaeta]|uniref:Uncharacterized protein n=1 Tax=Macroventuria anomochaeta TaxID=301207 RepID=A0ACB6SDY3_9PLEO|nr:uncharacterized protein BU25DRAFT_445646 [Macroventuria anomochaeta]KAF2631529.1 hypothetical protein BU25DRAFT_445646 [Macroventuria anomochaeta]
MIAQLLSLPRRSSFGVLGKEKSIGLGGGAAVSPYACDRSCVEDPDEALNAALTSWPSVELVRMERRWRGLKVVEGIVDVVLIWVRQECLIWSWLLKLGVETCISQVGFDRAMRLNRPESSWCQTVTIMQAELSNRISRRKAQRRSELSRGRRISVFAGSIGEAGRLCSEAEVYYCCEPEMVTARGESDLILNTRDCDRAGAVCMRAAPTIVWKWLGRVIRVAANDCSGWKRRLQVLSRTVGMFEQIASTRKG